MLVDSLTICSDYLFGGGGEGYIWVLRVTKSLVYGQNAEVGFSTVSRNRQATDWQWEADVGQTADKVCRAWIIQATDWEPEAGVR